MSNVIKPTIGRVVLYWPSGVNVNDPYVQPNAATVAYVHSNRCVNLSVSDVNGNVSGRTLVPLVQPEDDRPADGFFCEWMKYQIGQAAKDKEVEKTEAKDAGEEATQAEA